MARSVINVASSTTSEKYAKVPREAWSIPWKKAEQEQDLRIEVLNLNSVRFNSNHSAILAGLNLKT